MDSTFQGNFLRVVGGDDNKPEGQLKQPVGVTCDSHGLIYVTQMKPACVKVIPKTSSLLSI